MFKLRFLIITLFVLSSITTLQAQTGEKSSFMIMTSHGYMSAGPRIRGSGHINTFLYCPNNFWAYGGEFGIARGRNHYEKHIDHYKRIDRILNFSLAPCIYSFILNNQKHQIYLGTSVGFSYTDINGLNMDHKGLGVTFGSSAGYNYKFKKHWMIGTRFYHNYNLFDVAAEDNISSSIMGLINIGFRF